MKPIPDDPATLARLTFDHTIKMLTMIYGAEKIPFIFLYWVEGRAELLTNIPETHVKTALEMAIRRILEKSPQHLPPEDK